MSRNPNFKTINTKYLKLSPVLINEEVQKHQIPQYTGDNKEKPSNLKEHDLTLNNSGGGGRLSAYDTLKEIGKRNNAPKFGKMLKKYYCKIFIFLSIFIFLL